MRKALTAVIAVLVVLTLIAAFFTAFFFIDGQIYSVFSRSVDLSESQAADLSSLERCISLRSLDLSGAENVDIDTLCSLTELESLDLSGTKIDDQSLFSVIKSLPDCDVICTAELNGNVIDRNTEAVTLDDISAQSCAVLLTLDNLKTVDASACTAITHSILAADQNKSGDFIWKVSICGQNITSDASQLSLTSPAAADLQWLQLFHSLEKVTVTDCADLAALLELSEKMPGCSFDWDVDLCGIKARSTDTRLDISGHTVSDFEAFSNQLAYLPALEYIDMCRCGLTNDQMETLTKLYPDTKFVWEITFGHEPVMWTVRTDITCFSSQGMIRCDDEDIVPLLKYCTDLVALDLGHHNFSDLTLFSNLTKLKVLILGDTPVKDLSPLAELKELQYIEIFLCRFSDVSPLAELPNLIDLCMGGNNITDITPLLSMKQLKRLWIPRCGLTRDQQAQLEDALPDCKFKFVIIDNLCEDWRVDERNIAIRKAFRNWMYVTEFRNWDDVDYMDGVELEETFAVTLR